jgi:hypothetical protein
MRPISVILAEVKPFLDRSTEFVCTAIDKAEAHDRISHEEASRCHIHIATKLEGRATYMVFLLRTVPDFSVPADVYGRVKLRRTWLDNLIESEALVEVEYGDHQ